ncbi:MAG: hypothetical protein U1C33_08130, partial [Candidatus Cloacimonadaceae bacterium]|nr:hypothetical protein [Candidatus Cloacimonadaceae bacterium]
YLVLCTMLVFALGLGAFSQAAMLALGFETSATTHAIGGYNTTVANAWNSDPLMTYGNPALAAFQPGFSYSVIKYKWLPDIQDDMSYHAALAVLGYKGIAIILPAINQKSKWSIYMDMGEQIQYDELANEVGTYRSYDSYKVYGVAINPFETYRGLSEDHPPLLKHFDLALGLSYIDLESYLGPGTNISPEDAKAKASIYNLGLLAKANYRFGDVFNAEASFGLTRFNPENTKVSYFNQAQKDPILRYRNTGFGVFCSVPMEALLDMIPSEYLFTENLISLKGLHGEIDWLFGHDDEITTGYGMELGLLDTIYLRHGYYKDETGQIKGDTTGFGINLHYRDYFSLRYNSATFPGGALTKEHKSSDLGININFMKLIE